MKRPAADEPIAHAAPGQLQKRFPAWHTTLRKLRSWLGDGFSWPRRNSINPEEKSLAKWMSHQRTERREGSLPTELALALENLPGWSWAPQAARWCNVFSTVKYWVAAHDSLPHQGSDDVVEASLAQWITKQRLAKGSGLLAVDRVAELEQWPEWTWLPRVDQWQASLVELRLWLSDHQEQLPQRNAENQEEAALATWVGHQRGARQNGLLSQDRLRALAALSVWTWQPREVQWEAWYQLAWTWFFGPPWSPEAPRPSYPRSTKHHVACLRSSAEVHAMEGPSFADGLEELNADQPEHHQINEQCPARPLALWMLRQRLAYRHGTLSQPRSERLQQLHQWTWTRVGGQLETKQGWDHHFKHVLDWLNAHQGRLPSDRHPESAFEQRLGDWWHDNLCQFRNATHDPTSPGCCHEHVTLPLRKSIVPATEEERSHWKPTSTLTQQERLHWSMTLPKLFTTPPDCSEECCLNFSSGDFWCKIDHYLQGVLSVPEKYRRPLTTPSADKEWGPEWKEFFDRIDPSILDPRAFAYIIVPSPPMPWDRVRHFMLTGREKICTHGRFKGNAKAQELLVEIDTGLIAQGAHKRAGSRVGCPCCVPELHVCKSFPILRRCSVSYPPYDFVCTEGVWQCTGQWNDPVIIVRTPPSQLCLEEYSFQPDLASTASSYD